jgi:hypothetical protein
VFSLTRNDVPDAVRKLNVIRDAFLVHAREDLGISIEADELESTLALERSSREAGAADAV